MRAQVWDAWQRFIQPLVSKVGLLVRILLVGTPGYRSTNLGAQTGQLAYRLLLCVGTIGC